MRSTATAARIAAGFALLLPLLAAMPGASAHGFAGFEVSGVRMLEASGSENSSYLISRHGEPEWHFEITFSAGVAGGNGSRLPVILRVEHGSEILKEYRGVSGAISAPTVDTADFYINWTNPNLERVELRFRVAFVGPPTPLVLWAILACGIAVLTATVVVLVIDGLHSVGRGEVGPRYEGQVKASDLAKAMEEPDAKDEGEESSPPGEAKAATGVEADPPAEPVAKSAPGAKGEGGR